MTSRFDPTRPPEVSRRGIRASAIGGAVGILIGVSAPVVTFFVIRGRDPAAAAGGPPMFAVVLGALGVGLAFALVFLFVGRSLRRMTDPARRQFLLLQSGQPAQATVVSVSDTGMTINKNPQVRLELDVRGRDGGSYRTTTIAVVSRLAASRYQPGATVNVMVDPLDPKHVGLADTAGPAAPEQQS